MKKLVVLLMIVITCIFIAGCVMDSVTYCPYCKSTDIEEKDPGIYKCNKCTKTFGAKKIE